MPHGWLHRPELDTPLIQLRPYQSTAVNSVWKHFETKTGNPLLVLPTGTGKSLVLAAIASQAIQGWPQEPVRVLILAHVRELLRQDHKAILQVWPDAPVGIYSAGLNQRDLDARILVAGIQSIHRKAAKLQRVDLVLVDEAHLIGAKEQGMYRRFLKELNEINAGMLKIVGLTATPFRMDSGRLDEGPDAMFQRICYEADIGEMIEAGYLSHLVSETGTTQIDTSGVGTRGGEFIASELEAAVEDDEVNRLIAREIVAKGIDRGSWLVFACGIRHAYTLRDMIRSYGITAETVTGETPEAERDRIVAEFQAGRIRCITNMAVFTTGFDAPGTDLVALVRPTKSKGLYCQIVGRGTRLAPGKDDCAILDFGGNIARHGPIDRIDGRKHRKDESDEPGAAPFRVCPDCETRCAAAARTCFNCGHPFPAPIAKVSIASSKLAIVARFAEPQWINVSKTLYGRHKKEGKPDSLVVTYACGLAQHREWVALEHGGYARQKACSWWQRRVPGQHVPANVEEALELAPSLPTPIAIQVRPVGKYTEIVGVKF